MYTSTLYTTNGEIISMYQFAAGLVLGLDPYSANYGTAGKCIAKVTNLQLSWNWPRIHIVGGRVQFRYMLVPTTSQTLSSVRLKLSTL